MTDSFTITVDCSRFNAYTARLAGAVGVPIQQAVRFEAAAVVKTAASWERIANMVQTRKSAAFRVLHRIDPGDGSLLSLNGRYGRGGGWPGLIWFRARASGTGSAWRPIGEWVPPSTMRRTGWHVSAADWAIAKRLWDREQNDVREEVQAALGARGLTMQSWVQIIDAVGIPLESAPPRSARVGAWVRQARAKRGPVRTGFASSATFGISGYGFEIRNRNRFAIKFGGAEKLKRAIRVRENAFGKALRFGAFESMKGIARLYPGLVVR